MSRKNFKISNKKYEKALELLTEGNLNYSEIAQEVGICRNTLQKIREDEDTHKSIYDFASNNIKVAVGKASETLVGLLSAKSEMVRLEAAKQILGLNGIQVTGKLDMTAELKTVIVDDIGED